MNGMASSKVRRLLTIPIVVEACVLAWFLLLSSEALTPSFRGGRFIAATLVFGTVLIAAVLLRDVIVALWSDVRPREASETPVTVDEDSEQTPNWTLVAAAVATMVGFFAAIVVLGTLLGITVTSWVILRVHSKLNSWRAAIGAGAIGIGLPIVFADLLDLNLWPGLLPALIPDWIGGGLLPPL